MKTKILAAVAAAILASGTAYAAMDCCKDGKCECCAKKDGDKKDDHTEHKM